MDHVMSNFGNINNKTELEMKVSLLEKENFELRDQLINKLLIIKELKTDSKSNQFTAKNYKYNWRKFVRKNIQFS